MDSPDEAATLTAAEAAAQLGVKPRTIYLYVQQGLLEAEERQAGRVRRLRFTPTAVAACKARLAQQKQ